MPNILVVYGSSHGHTAKVVDRIVNSLITHGHQLTVLKGDEVGTRPLDEFEGFLIAGSVLFGRHQSYLRRFVKRNVERLNRYPSAFVSVCGALMGSWPQGPAEAEKYVTKFLQQTGWRPRLTTSVAGALPYTRYGRIERLVMRLISRHTGRPTDTSRDWEFTDWDEVERFAAEFAGKLEPTVVSGTARSEVRS